jgi:hypothetical protein
MTNSEWKPAWCWSSRPITGRPGFVAIGEAFVRDIGKGKLEEGQNFRWIRMACNAMQGQVGHA